MKTTQLTIPYDAEKLTALRQYASKKDVSIDAELTDAVDKLYEKLIPQAVREYIEHRDVAPNLPPRTSSRRPMPPNRVNQPSNTTSE